MGSDFHVTMLGFETSEYGREEIRETCGNLRIEAMGQIATRSSDDWSKSVKDHVRLSAYPMAVWIAASWWRLRWEPQPSQHRRQQWRLAHDLRAIGGGYVWPRLSFDTDGEWVNVKNMQSIPNKVEPIRYLDAFSAPVSAREFELEIDRFVDSVVARLLAVDVRGSDLQRLWAEVRAERQDPETSALRRAEAELGYDPDEAPGDAISGLQQLATRAGAAAAHEIAPVCAGDRATASLGEVFQMASSTTGILGNLGDLRKAVDLNPPALNAKAAPWNRGRDLARATRALFNLGSDGVSDSQIADLLGVKSEALSGQGHMAPLGLCVRTGDSLPGIPARMMFRRSRTEGRRFEAARFIAEAVSSPASDRWLPTTDAKTARQKAQRAFAAEFLAPIESLVEFMGDDFSDETVDAAGDHFGVSPLLIASHLANNGVARLAGMQGFDEGLGSSGLSATG